MGYTTSFFNSFTLDKPLTDIQIEYLQMFSETRRMKRDYSKLINMQRMGQGNTRCFELLKSLGLYLGYDGEFYCGTGFCGQDGGYAGKDTSVIDYNSPPTTQKGLWCQWVPTDDGMGIEWNGTEKFYNYIEWLEYIIDNFLTPWGIKVNGMVEWSGEDHDDIGVIEVINNIVDKHEGKTVKWLEDSRKKTESAIAASESLQTTSKPIQATPDFIMDLIKLRNELSTAKKGTAVACKKIDELIAKYEA
jgi:hypothetical protein